MLHGRATCEARAIVIHGARECAAVNDEYRYGTARAGARREVVSQACTALQRAYAFI